jgi:WD40 repeat protein
MFPGINIMSIYSQAVLVIIKSACKHLLIHLSCDLREEKALKHFVGHSGSVNSIDFNYFNQNLFITGSSDSTVALWDMRNLKVKLHVFHLPNQVNGVKWNSFTESIFASNDLDKNLSVWDVNKIGTSQSLVEEEDGPVELIVSLIFSSKNYY